MLLIGGGFDTTTALTAHSLEWLSQNPAERDRLQTDLAGLIDTATEEFLRFYTPAPGDGRTVTREYELSGRKLEEGDRLYLSFAMANRDPSVFPDPRHHPDRPEAQPPHQLRSRPPPLHRLERGPSHVQDHAHRRARADARLQCDPSGAVHYDTVGVINGMKHLPATFTPGKRLGPGLEETIAAVQRQFDEERLAEPITRTPRADREAK